MGTKFQELNVQTPEVTLYVHVAGNLTSGNVLIAIHGGPGRCPPSQSFSWM
jgi:hypothetical protein